VTASSENFTRNDSARALAAWALAERTLRSRFSNDFHRHALDWVCEDLKPRVIEMLLRSKVVEIPGAPIVGRAVMAKSLQRVTLSSFVQLVKLERELYEAKFGLSALRMVAGGAPSDDARRRASA
jgi:hypothetical protein